MYEITNNYDYLTLTIQLLLLHLCDPIHTAPGNGGITATYRWTQTLSDLMIMVPLPEGTKTKALDIVFTNNKLKVKCGLFLVVFKPLLLLIAPFPSSFLPFISLFVFPSSFFVYILPSIYPSYIRFHIILLLFFYLLLTPPLSPLPLIPLLLQVAVKGQTPIINGEFHKRVIVDDSFWTIEDGEFGKNTIVLPPV